MKIHKSYVVYTTNRLLGSHENLSLDKMVFKNFSNNFKNEKDAIDAIISENNTNKEFLILKRVFLISSDN